MTAPYECLRPKIEPKISSVCTEREDLECDVLNNTQWSTLAVTTSPEESVKYQWASADLIYQLRNNSVKLKSPVYTGYSGTSLVYQHTLTTTNFIKDLMHAYFGEYLFLLLALATFCSLLVLSAL